MRLRVLLARLAVIIDIQGPPQDQHTLARLTAIHSFFRYTALHAPDHAALIQRVLAIPSKRFDRAIVSYLTQAEADALIAAPDRSTWIGRRDHALLLTDVHTGLRVSELTGLKLHDVHLDTGPHLRCHGLCRTRHRPCYATAGVMPSHGCR